MLLIDHYDKKEKEYKLLTLDEILNLKNHCLIIGNKQEVYRVKINGKVRTWKKDLNRFEVPVKYGLYEYYTVTTLNELVRECN